MSPFPSPKRVLHSYGALQCLDKLLALTADDGFILINDYGQTQASREDMAFAFAEWIGRCHSLMPSKPDKQPPRK